MASIVGPTFQPIVVTPATPAVAGGATGATSPLASCFEQMGRELAVANDPVQSAQRFAAMFPAAMAVTSIETFDNGTNVKHTILMAAGGDQDLSGLATASDKLRYINSAARRHLTYAIEAKSLRDEDAHIADIHWLASQAMQLLDGVDLLTFTGDLFKAFPEDPYNLLEDLRNAAMRFERSLIDKGSFSPESLKKVTDVLVAHLKKGALFYDILYNRSPSESFRIIPGIIARYKKLGLMEQAAQIEGLLDAIKNRFGIYEDPTAWVLSRKISHLNEDAAEYVKGQQLPQFSDNYMLDAWFFSECAARLDKIAAQIKNTAIRQAARKQAISLMAARLGYMADAARRYGIATGTI